MATTRKRAGDGADEGFSEAERVAMQERARELRAAKRGSKADGESDVLAKIAEVAAALAALG